MSEPFSVSLSAVQAFRRCQQQYYYRYVERLRRRDKPVPLELGIVLHDYLGSFYEELERGNHSADAHEIALMAVTKKHLRDIKRMATATESYGNSDVAAELLEIPAKVNRIATRYYNTRGQFDAQQYVILSVERPLKLRLTPSIVSNGRFDLVTQDQHTGLIALWEHKSTGNVPDEGYRMRDLQTALYSTALKPWQIDHVVWNYIRTKEPTKPKQLVKGGISRDKSIDTTWEVYAAALTKAGEPHDFYKEMKDLLYGREEAVFFPRYERTILAGPRLLEDYTRTAKDIRAYRKAWESGKAQPVRTLEIGCSWCEFKDLCNSAIVNNDDSDVKQMRFVVTE